MLIKRIFLQCTLSKESLHQGKSDIERVIATFT